MCSKLSPFGDFEDSRPNQSLSSSLSFSVSLLKRHKRGILFLLFHPSTFYFDLNQYIKQVLKDLRDQVYGSTKDFSKHVSLVFARYVEEVHPCAEWEVTKKTLIFELESFKIRYRIWYRLLEPKVHLYECI